MEIVLADLKEDSPVQLEKKLDIADWEIEFDDLKYPKALELTASVLKGTETLTLHGTLSGERVRTCGRCLKSHTANFSDRFDLYYEIGSKTVIDTRPDLREQLILDRSIAFHCPEGCYGLCPECGSNLSAENKCPNAKCKTQTLHNSPFAALKNKWAKKK